MSDRISDNPFGASARFSGSRVHLGICGSIACYKSADLLRALLTCGIRVSATLSRGCREFITSLLIRSLGAEAVYDEMFAGADPFAHLEPGRNAQCLLVAPASADMLAKMASGYADDMLSAQYLAFSGKTVVAPAMNPRMWAHPATQRNISLLKDRDIALVPPGIGKTACGEEGQGRLASLCQIFLTCLKALSPQDMKGLRVMATLGPTREYWDGARFWSNPSSGRMGAALVTAAWLRGAQVTAICGPGIEVCLPDEAKRIHVQSAREMFMAAQNLWPEMDMGLFSAAVADFAPVRPQDADNVKIGKGGRPERFELEFTTNPDILATLARSRQPGQKILGFAAEATADMQSLLPLAQAKLERKKADIIAGNRINDGAFGSVYDSMAVVDINGKQEIWSPRPKSDIAWELLTWLLNI